MAVATEQLNLATTNKTVIVIGISGTTCSGKTTIAMELKKLLPDSTIFCQDDYYFPVEDPRHVWIPELNHINFDILGSLDMERMTQDIEAQIKKESSKIITPPIPKHEGLILCFRNQLNKNLHQIVRSKCHVVIVEGFCIFNHKPLADLCDLKYYFTLQYEECLKRRVSRVYEPPDCPGYFEKCAWPEHLKQLVEVQEKFNDIVYFDENSKEHVPKITTGMVKAFSLTEL